MTVEKRDVMFKSGETFTAGWFPPPQPARSGERLHVVAMAHGFGAVKEMYLEPFARRFAAAGIAVPHGERKYPETAVLLSCEGRGAQDLWPSLGVICPANCQPSYRSKPRSSSRFAAAATKCRGRGDSSS
jgi:hypothetical protein